MSRRPCAWRPRAPQASCFRRSLFGTSDDLIGGFVSQDGTAFHAAIDERSIILMRREMASYRCRYLTGPIMENAMNGWRLSRTVRGRLARAALVTVGIFTAVALHAAPLHGYGADAMHTSVSGLSSGA